MRSVWDAKGLKSRRIALVLIVLVVGWLLLLPGPALADGPAVDEIREAIRQQQLQWTAREYDETFATGHLFELEPETPREPLSRPRPASLPSWLDWRSNGGNFVSPVKSQGNCGSCWAFASVGAFEALRAIVDDSPGSFLNLSEQILVSCCTENSGCNGGSMYYSAEFLRDEGTYHETCFPYTATDNDCSNACWDWRSRAFKIESHAFVSRSVSDLKTALQEGPFAVAFNVYSDFRSYGSGIYECSNFSGEPTGHAVLLVGYRDTPDQTGGGYFIVKNSWGTGWGESGYFRIGYSQVTNDVRFGRSAYQYFLSCPDPYEPDGTYSQATSISTDGALQRGHRFCEAGDQDWIKFYALERWTYTIETCNLGSGCDTFMYLYDQNASAVIAQNDDGGTGLASRISWSAGVSGWYYVKVRHYSSSRFGTDTKYDIKVESEEPPNRPPNLPSSPSPADGAADQPANLDLSWTGGDPDAGDRVTYNVCLDTSNPPTTHVCDGAASPRCSVGGLNYDTAYYWRVTGVDNHGAWKTGPVWEFRTAPNSAPGAVSVSPDSGSSAAGELAEFVARYSDSNGWPDIKRACLSVGQHYLGADGFRAYYSQDANRVYLMNDDGTAWLGGVPPGSSPASGGPGDPEGSAAIENSKVILRPDAMTVTGWGNTLSVKWSVRFKRFTAGDKTIYLNVQDDGDLGPGWRVRGDWTVNGTNYPPLAEAVSPASGTSNAGDAVDFTTSCSDPNGWSQIKWVTLAIGEYCSGADGLYAYYNQTANKVYLTNDAGTGWVGGLPPGSSQTIENSKVILRLAPMTVSGAGNVLEVKWSLRFKRFATGAKTIYLKVTDGADATSGWRSLGSWTVNGTNFAPGGDSVSPNSGSCDSAEVAEFAAVYSDPNGWPHIKWATFCVGQGRSGADGLYAYYNVRSNKVYLMNDEGTAWLGGLPPGSPETIENSKVIVRPATMSVSGAGNKLTVNWSVRFKRFVTGDKSLYLKATDDGNATCGWNRVGSWAVNGTDYAPAVESVVPNSGSCDYGAIVDFATTVSDANGWPQIKWIVFAIGGSYSGIDGLRAYYSQNSNKVYLISDDGTVWLGGSPPGSAVTIENSRIMLRITPMTVAGTGDLLTVNWSLRFKRSAVGLKNIYVRVCDDAGLCTSEEWIGAWTVRGPDLGTDVIGWSGVLLDPIEEPESDGDWFLPVLEPLEEGSAKTSWRAPGLEPMEEGGEGLWVLTELPPVEDGDRKTSE